MPRLMIQEGGSASVFELLDDDVTIGRGASSAIQVSDSHASKNHAVIRKVNGRPKFIDLESKNGTRVNGEFRNQRWLEHADTITIGAAVLTYDGSDVVAARPGARPAAPARASAAAVAAPAAVASPRPLPAPAPARPSASRRRSRDEEYDDDEEERPSRRRSSSNSVPVAVLMGLSALALVAIMFLLLSHSGAGKNAMTLRHAKEMSRAGDNQGALDYLLQNGDPSDEDGYVSVQEEINKMKDVLAAQASIAKEGEAQKVLNRLVHDQVESWKPEFSEQAFAERVRKFVQDYQGTNAVRMVMASPEETYVKLRARLNPPPPR